MKYYWIELDAYKSAENMKHYVEKVIKEYGVDYEIKFTYLHSQFENYLKHSFKIKA